LDYFIAAIARDNRDSADALGLVLFELIRALRDGPDGVQRSLNTLRLRLERLFLFTNTHKSSFTLFLCELEGLPGEMPVTLTAPLKPPRAKWTPPRFRPTAPEREERSSGV